MLMFFIYVNPQVFVSYFQDKGEKRHQNIRQGYRKNLHYHGISRVYIPGEIEIQKGGFSKSLPKYGQPRLYPNFRRSALREAVSEDSSTPVGFFPSMTPRIPLPSADSTTITSTGFEVAQ